jgi:hypothetical protein
MKEAQVEERFAPMARLPSEQGEQLAWLKRLIEVFHRAQDGRIKTLRRQLDDALVQLALGHEAGTDADELGRDFAARIERLRHDTFDVLLTIVNQVRGTLRAKLQGGMSKTARDEAERLQDGLQLFSKGLRQVLLAAQSGDAAAEAQGSRQLDEAARALDGKV